MGVWIEPIFPPPPAGQTQWGQLHGNAPAWLIARAAESQQNLIMVLTADLHMAYRLEAELRFFTPSTPLYLFPDWETLPYDIFSPLEDIISERLKLLARLPKLTRGILIVPITTLMHRLPPTHYVQAHTLSLQIGDTFKVDTFRQQLEQAGYRAVHQVMAHGEYATRGSIFDLFPMGSDVPYRVDLFDDAIDTIRSFDPETQRTQDKISTIELLPAREFPLDKASITLFRQHYREQLGGDLSRSQVYDAVSRGQPPAGIEYYLPLFFGRTATLFDYLPERTLLILDEKVSDAMTAFWHSIEHRYEERRHDIERPLLEPKTVFLSPNHLEYELARYRRIQLSASSAVGTQYPTQSLPPLLLQTRHAQPLIYLTEFLKTLKGRVLFTAESAGRREALLQLFREQQLTVKVLDSWQAFLASDEAMVLTVAPLGSGFWLKEPALAVIPEALLHGTPVQQQRRRKKTTRDADAIIRNLTDLTEGAPVVHEEHGVGRYLGMQTLTTSGMTSEYLTLEYAGGDRLYVPVTALHLISRYTGVTPDAAPLHRLGNEQWDKSRRKAAEKARDVAVELLDIHARRAAQQGQAFALDELEYQQFSAGFPFEETPDQALAIESVMSDMRSTRPMDRVVCGDVGFGKTEVAMRATFIAANAGKQVAIIAPTTLLVQQHLNNFRDRFADWPFVIESLSRFKTAAQVKQALEKVKLGQVDIVIGTHKLLQEDVVFKNLGLVIIDEEHRFGVRHKEQLKKLRTNVDMLTMTATPIPRTLNMSLSGLRDLSIIATPPVQRHAIKTFVTEWNPVLIQEACAREIARGGQIYVLHNEVDTIAKMADDLQQLLPQAKIQFAHGQMRERGLETIMQDFYHQRFQILVATTIIENGIDVPTANTIIINRADKLGLAQLHQLRGRVGRSHHRAYAYLITPPRKHLTLDAQKRLEAIESLEDLGVGFTLATHDLEIRGAGELLGEDQSGQIQEIGFHLYNDLLQRAVKALKTGKVIDLAQVQPPTTIDLGTPALIPEAYLPDVHSRLILYKRIASAETQDALDELKVEMIDRFGLLPEPTQSLFNATELKLLAQPLGIRKLDSHATGGRILFDAKPNIDPIKIIHLIQKRPWEFRLEGSDKLRLLKAIPTVEERILWIKQLLQEFH